MDKRDILQRIIDSTGACDVLYNEDKTICSYCPMSKMAQREDGTYLSCWDALGLDDTFGGDHEVNEAYRNKAIELLSDILIDDILRGKDIAEES